MCPQPGRLCGGSHHSLGAVMKYIVLMLSVLIFPSVLFAAEEARQPITMEQILQDLRDLDSSMDRMGDHVVGEEMC